MRTRKRRPKERPLRTVFREREERGSRTVDEKSQGLTVLCSRFGVPSEESIP